MADNRPICDQKIRLVQTYKATASQYSKAVSDLAPAINSSEFGPALRRINLALAVSQEAREDLERHIAEHHC